MADIPDPIPDSGPGGITFLIQAFFGGIKWTEYGTMDKGTRYADASSGHGIGALFGQRMSSEWLIRVNCSRFSAVLNASKGFADFLDDLRGSNDIFRLF
jgi:hypothetical protein